jgi:hypothetical protein
MPLKTWIGTTDASGDWVRRSTRGRRASDRLPRIEQVLATGVILAWTWGVYELVRLYIR